VKTVDSWLGGTPQQPSHGWFFKAFGRPIPRLAAQRPGGYPPIDWEEAYAVAAAATEVVPTLDLIVDEAQDLDRNFWQIVLPYCRSCTVLCDTNQTLHAAANSNFSDRDFAAILGIEEGDEDHWAKLNINYRNSGNIVKAVNEFRPPAEDGVLVSLPDSTRPGPKPVIRHSESFDECVDHIAKVMVNYPQLSHGVLTTSTRDLTKVMKRLNKLSTSKEFSKLRFQEYQANARNVDPCQKGILATYGTNVKGLEFDYVYVIALQNWAYPLDTAGRNKLYVCMTRARTNLEIMWDGDGNPPILEELPKKHFDYAE
jgi:DNA helicase IV